MAELLECLLCGYQTVRCGMGNHLKHKHPKELAKYNKDIMDKAYGLRFREVVELTKSLGQVKHWSKDRTQKPTVQGEKK